MKERKREVGEKKKIKKKQKEKKTRKDILRTL